MADVDYREAYRMACDILTNRSGRTSSDWDEYIRTLLTDRMREIMCPSCDGHGFTDEVIEGEDFDHSFHRCIRCNSSGICVVPMVPEQGTFRYTVLLFIGFQDGNLTRLADHLECSEATVCGWATGTVIPDIGTQHIVEQAIGRWMAQP